MLDGANDFLFLSNVKDKSSKSQIQKTVNWLSNDLWRRATYQNMLVGILNARDKQADRVESS